MIDDCAGQGISMPSDLDPFFLCPSLAEIARVWLAEGFAPLLNEIFDQVQQSGSFIYSLSGAAARIVGRATRTFHRS